MIYVYGAVLLLVIILMAASRKYKKEIFSNLDTREDPLKFLYPAAARVLDSTRIMSFAPVSRSKANTVLKQLYVSENVERKEYVYTVRRYAVLILIISAACILGVLLCIKNPGPEQITSLPRNEYGQGSQIYSLEAEYGGKAEQIELEIAERKLSDSEIDQVMDEAQEPIRQAVLGENKTWNHVDRPLNLITEYGSIHISWEIDDPDLVDYSGELTDELEPGESLLVNLKANMKLEEKERLLVIPANITASSADGWQSVMRSIKKAMAYDDSAYDESVTLPDEIGGKKITFRTIASGSGYTIPLLTLIAGIIVFAGYDRTLEDKLKKRNEQLMADFSEIVFKLSLLFEAGMSIRGAWEKIVDEAMKNGKINTRYAFQEMKLVSEKINSGMSEAECYGQFGKRCGLHRYVKFGNILQQNLSKGTKGMKELLTKEAEEAFEERKRAARKKGEEAGTKMLIPMVMMLLIVIVIVAVPALMSLGL